MSLVGSTAHAVTNLRPPTSEHGGSNCFSSEKVNLLTYDLDPTDYQAVLQECGDKPLCLYNCLTRLSTMAISWSMGLCPNTPLAVRCDWSIVTSPSTLGSSVDRWEGPYRTLNQPTEHFPPELRARLIHQHVGLVFDSPPAADQ